MKCPLCSITVLNNSDYSVHMNKLHRGESYQELSSYETNKETKDLNSKGFNSKNDKKYNKDNV
jgi:uncharacterized C2H2 Zn-finger protein